MLAGRLKNLSHSYGLTQMRNAYDGSMEIVIVSWAQLNQDRGQLFSRLANPTGASGGHEIVNSLSEVVSSAKTHLGFVSCAGSVTSHRRRERCPQVYYPLAPRLLECRLLGQLAVGTNFHRISTEVTGRHLMPLVAHHGLKTSNTVRSGGRVVATSVPRWSQKSYTAAP